MTNRELIEDMYHSFLEKRKEIFDNIHKDEKRIEEIDKFLNSISVLDEDYSIFSPFKADEISDGQVSENKEEKENLLSDIETNYQLVEEIDFRISQFKEALKEEVPGEVPEEKEINLTSEEMISFFEDEDTIGLSIIDIQEKERQRISNDLHDTTVQNLVHLIHSLELSSKFIDQDPLRAKLEIETCIKTLRSTIDGIRETIFNLRPMSFNDLGFKKCIDDFMNNMQVHNPSVKFNVEVDDIGNNSELNIIIFRIIQECVTNSLKHSKSEDLVVKVSKIDSNCDIIVSDSGIGFSLDNPKSNHFGMAILKDRVKVVHGSIEIDSSNVGTKIHIIIPLNLK